MASIHKRPDNRYRARYRDDAGKEHARHFRRKVDAQRWLDELTASVVTGQYVAPNAGNITLREYAEGWRAVQVHRPATQEHVETNLRRHVYPTIGDRKLSSIVPSDVQTLVSRLDLAPSTVGVIHSILSSVMRSAVRDRRIAVNPCDGTKLPKAEVSRVVPVTTEQVEALREGLPDHLRALVTFAAGTGLRQGECFGLTLDRLDMLRRTVTVDRQLVRVRGRGKVFGPPKTAASVRVVPLPRVVVDELAAHLAAYPPGGVGFVFTHLGEPLGRSTFGNLWRGPARAAGVPLGQGLHALRHYYASLLIRHGESVKTVQARLGHSSATETLDTYSHLWPDSDDRTREAVDAVLGARRVADYLRTDLES